MYIYYLFLVFCHSIFSLFWFNRPFLSLFPDYSDIEVRTRWLTLPSFSKLASNMPSEATLVPAISVSSEHAAAVCLAIGSDSGDSKIGSIGSSVVIMWNIRHVFGSSTSTIFSAFVLFGLGAVGNCNSNVHVLFEPRQRFSTTHTTTYLIQIFF